MQELPAGFEEKASLAGGGRGRGHYEKKRAIPMWGCCGKMNSLQQRGVDNILLMQVDADYLNSQLFLNG